MGKQWWLKWMSVLAVLCEPSVVCAQTVSFNTLPGLRVPTLVIGAMANGIVPGR